GHRAGGHPTDLRALRKGGNRPRRGRFGTRPGDRPRDRRSPWWHRARRQHAGSGRYVRHRAAGHRADAGRRRHRDADRRRPGMSRVLIAEDEARIASFVQKGLRAAGFAPTVVADGRAALDYAMTGEFDLMVLDLGLPVVDGFSVLRQLREARNDIPVVILTARDSVTD